MASTESVHQAVIVHLIICLLAQNPRRYFNENFCPVTVGPVDLDLVLDFPHIAQAIATRSVWWVALQ